MLSSCAKGKIRGLWQVDHILARSDDFTPEARWIRIEKDGYQESGNGWQKHSYGTWILKKKKITIVNENGPVDEDGPFEVSFNKKDMTWERREEGKRVRVS